MRQYSQNPVGRMIHRAECKLAREDWLVEWLDGCTAEHIRAYLGLRKELVACRRCNPHKESR